MRQSRGKKKRLLILKQGLVVGSKSENLRQGLDVGRKSENLRQGLVVGRKSENLKQGLVIRTKTGVSETKLGHATHNTKQQQEKWLPKKKTHM